MRKLIAIGVVIILALSIYIVFTLFFAQVFLITSSTPPPATTTPAPTFTPTPTSTPFVVAQTITAPAPFTPTPFLTLSPTKPPSPTPTVASPTNTPTAAPPTATPEITVSPTITEPTSSDVPVVAQIVAFRPVNVRSGPGTQFEILGALPSNTPFDVSGQSEDRNWWQVDVGNNQTGWVAAWIVQAFNDLRTPVAQSGPQPPPPPPPAPAEPPTAAPQVAYQFEPTGWYADRNLGLTRFLGTIVDANGTPVNGVAVRAQCGTYSVISNPSGPVGGWRSNDSADDPPGFYDLTIDRRPIPCNWILTVVYTEDGQTALQELSQPVEVEVTVDASIITANWRKNW